MDEATFLEAIKDTEQQFDVNCRQVSNGFALAGNVRYCVPGTQNVKVAASFEAVATDGAHASELVANFLSTGKFNG
jgi:hypothetical protein